MLEQSWSIIIYKLLILHSYYLIICFISFQAFLSTNSTFSSRPQFRNSFCIDQIREGLIVGYLNFLVQFLSDLAKVNSLLSHVFHVLIFYIYEYYSDMLCFNSYLFPLMQEERYCKTRLKSNCCIYFIDHLFINLVFASYYCAYFW